MELFTASIRYWRQLKQRDIELIDTTIGSGEQAFAPTWDMVMAHKRQEISDEQYTDAYLNLMRCSYITERPAWDRLLLTQHPIAIGCYCNNLPGTFCHRHLLRDILEKICRSRNIPFHFYGEFR